MPQDNVIGIRVVVKDDGSIVLKQVAQSTEDLGKKAAAGSEGMVKLNAAGAEATSIFQGLGQEGAGLLGRFGGLLTVLGPVGIGLGAAAYAATTAVSAFTGFATQVRDLSFLSGASTRDTSILVAGLERMGVSTGAVEIALRTMSAAVENGSPVLNKLRISLIDMSGQLKSGLTLFYETIDALRGMSNETERNRLSQQLFGRSFLELILAIQRGSGAIKELGEASGKMVMPEDLERVRQYKLGVAELGEWLEKVKIAAAKPIVFSILWSLNALQPTQQDLGPAIKALMQHNAAIGGAGTYGVDPNALIESYLTGEAALQKNVTRFTAPAAPAAPATGAKILEQCNRVLAIFRAAVRSQRPTEESRALLDELDEGAELLQEATEFLKEVTSGPQSRPDPHP